MNIDSFISQVDLLVKLIEQAKRVPDSDHRNRMYTQGQNVKKMIQEYYSESSNQKELF